MKFCLKKIKSKLEEKNLCASREVRSRGPNLQKMCFSNSENQSCLTKHRPKQPVKFPNRSQTIIIRKIRKFLLFLVVRKFFWLQESFKIEHFEKYGSALHSLVHLLVLDSIYIAKTHLLQIGTPATHFARGTENFLLGVST